MNDPANIDNYTESMSQALNFGVYSADLAMAASYGEGTNTIAYFKVIRKLGESLNINSAFDETVFKRIEENEIKLNAITSSANDAIIMFDEYGQINFWNLIASSLFGYEKDEVIGQNIRILFSYYQTRSE